MPAAWNPYAVFMPARIAFLPVNQFTRNRPMLDLAYIALSVAFFALMLWYTRGCERLGRGHEAPEKKP
jgi:hypothetical protein